ncbi:MAG: hypothetical protein ACKVOP_07005 [Sphingomonadaceae bacterium]
MRTGIDHLKAVMATLAASFALAVSPAATQTISNTAQLEWSVGATTVATPSNRVDLMIERPSATLSLATFNFSSDPNAERLPVPETICRGSGGDIPVIIDGAFANTPRDPASVERTTQVRAGEPLIVGITSVADNARADTIDTMLVTLTTPGGDSETLILRETGANTSVFVGLIRTSAVPPAPVSNDCQLSLHPGDVLNLEGTRPLDGSLIAMAPIEVLIDPFGIVFDSADGTPIPGVRITLIDDATGLPAIVFGDDAVSRFPSSVITGSTVTDSSGATYAFPPGDYRFPFVRPGRYRVVVEPPTPYTAPSLTTPAELAGLLRPDGVPFTIIAGSYGEPFPVFDPAPVRVDIPIDRPGAALTLRKSASTAVAVPGDAVQYRIIVTNGDATRTTGIVTVNDRLPDTMRLKANSVRYNDALQTYTVSPDGRDLTISLPPLAARASGTVTYLLEVRPDAKPGQTLNRAQARDSRGTTSAVADATVRIVRDGLSDRMTIIGRITDGGCAVDPDAANGIGGVRVMLEDGSYAVTDPDGRYHFEGVVPGMHVVQFDASTLGASLVPADCTRNARSGGSAISRFVTGQGGALVRVDFRAQAGTNAALPATTAAPRTPAASDAEAAGAERNWLENEAPGIAWLFPGPDHNPRTKAIRVVIKHLPTQTVKLFANGKPVDALALDGTRKNGDNAVATTHWRALDLESRDTVFTAEVRDASGALVETLTRTVHYANAAMRAELVREKSVLIADGVTRPVIALRMTDRDGKPVHHGLVGDFRVPAPYYPAVEADAQAARQLAGLERARPVWRVEGDEGLAYIELEPTTASGALTITLPFRDGEVARTQRIDGWLTPGNRPWTVVGLAEGTVGFNSVERNLRDLPANADEWITSGRVALYAKGRVQGKWLLTLAYDSAKTGDEARFGGTIDPQAYYTIYADRSERRYDAASVRKLYVRLERPQFYALFGDFETGMVEPELTRYVRSFNGVKAQYRSEQVAATAFAADTPYRHRREEIQGNGLSGPYALAARNILPNSERISIETRDRLRSNRIVDTKVLVRHIDYDIDYVAGTLRFRSPVLSRSSLLDPQIIVADYEVDGIAQRVVNASGRATWSNSAKTLTVGASAIHDETDVSKTNVGGVDLRFTPNAQTEIRAEFARSDSNPKAGSTATDTGPANAWLIEAEHHGSKFDVLAYAREQQAGFGVGQLSGAETSTRKFGFDGRVRVTPDLSLIGSAWQEDYLGTSARRQAGQARVEYRAKSIDLRAGLTLADDRLADGRTAQSTVAQLGATKRLLSNRLELDAQTEFALGGKDDSIDVPARHRVGARFALTPEVAVVGSYEIAKGETVDARTARIGFDLKPWAGARIVASANQQAIAEYGPRSFAAYGLSQSLPVGKRWTVDLTLDGIKTLGGGIDATRVLNPAQPVASGGFIGSDGTLSEDFTAITAGATYRGDRWSMAARAEARAGDRSDRYGLTVSALRSLGEGRALGGQFSWFRAEDKAGPRSQATTLAVSWANRPDDSRWSWLEKLELRSDSVSGVTAGLPGPVGGAPSLVTGSASSKRIINSLSVNWSPVTRAEGRYLGRSEVSLFWGTRYVSDRIGADDLKGWSNVVGADIRFDLSETIDIGAAGTVRESNGGRALSYSGGPSISLSPFKNSYITLGYNVLGFDDRDYADARYTRSGPYVTLRLKFDQDSLAALGLTRR